MFLTHVFLFPHILYEGDGVRPDMLFENCSFISQCGKEVIIRDEYIYLFVNDKFYKKVSLIDKSADKIALGDKIYVSGKDTGCIFVYDYNLKINCSLKIGEHISDVKYKDGCLFVLVFNENRIYKVFDEKIISYFEFNEYPQTVIINNSVFVLTCDGWHNYIYMFDFSLNLIKNVKMSRQIGDIYEIFHKIVYLGEDKNYVFNRNLNLMSNKKSTGRNILCKCNNYPVFLEGSGMFDVWNNVTYPSAESHITGQLHHQQISPSLKQ